MKDTDLKPTYIPYTCDSTYPTPSSSSSSSSYPPPPAQKQLHHTELTYHKEMLSSLEWETYLLGPNQEDEIALISLLEPGSEREDWVLERYLEEVEALRRDPALSNGPDPVTRMLCAANRLGQTPLHQLLRSGSLQALKSYIGLIRTVELPAEAIQVLLTSA